MDLCSYPTPEKKRFFEIEAIEIPIVYNKYGDHDPNGLLYVLKKDAGRIRSCAMQSFSQKVPQPCKEVQPLVIRANKGETVVVTFTHSLNRPLSIHVQGMDYDVQTSDGACVGYNKDSTTLRRITYTWYTNREGVFLFHDMGNPTDSESGTNVHGLFDKDGKPLNPPEIPGAHDNPGVMGINYHYEPMRERLKDGELVKTASETRST